MAITHFLLQSNFNSSPMLQQTFNFRPSFPTKWSSRANNIALKRNYSPCCIKAFPKFTMNCDIINPSFEGRKAFGENRGINETGIINGVIWRSMEKVMKALQISLIAGVLSALMFLFDHNQGRRLALAASGGSMGGSSFSSDSSSSWSSGSSSDSSDISWYSSSESSSMTAGAEVVQIGTEVTMVIAACIVVCFVYVKWSDGDIDIAKTSVLKLQVGSSDQGKSLQRDLNQIARSADTSNRKGFHKVLQESILALLRNSNYCISGYSSVDVKWSVAGCEKLFNKLSIEERGKFDEETLVNVNNRKKHHSQNAVSATSQSSNELHNEYLVATIIVAARGVPELPPIKSSEQLKEALQKLASIPAKNIMGVEVLWTPQKEDDSLTEQQMLKDYPRLHPL